MRAWRGDTGECLAHVALPATPLLALAACATGGWRLAAHCTGALFLLGGGLEVTRVLRSTSELPRSSLLSLRCTPAPPLDGGEERARGGSSASLSALASVRAEEEELVLVGVEASGAAWRWRGAPVGDTHAGHALVGSLGAEAEAPALLGWMRGAEVEEEGDTAPPAPPQPPRGAAAACVSADGADALIVSAAGWAIVATARAAAGALPAPPRASGDGAFVGGAFIDARRLALWDAAGVHVLEVPASGGRWPTATPRELLFAACNDCALATSVAAEDGSLLLAVADARGGLSLWPVPATAPQRPPHAQPPLLRAAVSDGWPAGHDDAEGCVCVSLFVTGGAAAPLLLAQGHASGGISLRQLPPGGTLEAHAWLRGHAGAVRCLAATRTALLSGGDDATVRAWAPASGHLLAVLRHHTAPVCGLHPVGCDGMVLSEAADGVLGVLRPCADPAAPPTCNMLLPILHVRAGAAPRVNAVSWVPSAGCIALSRGGAVEVWDALTGALDRTVAGAEALIGRLATPAEPHRASPLNGDCRVAWAPVLRCDAAALLERRPAESADAAVWLPAARASSSAVEGGEEGRALRCALALLHVWGLDSQLDAQLAAECRISQHPLATRAMPAIASAEGAVTALTPTGAARHELLLTCARFVAARSLAVAALSRRLQRAGVGEGGHACAASLVAFYAVQLQSLPSPHAAPPALAVFVAAWQHSSEYVREAARALLASAPLASVPPLLLRGDVGQGDATSWRALEAAAGGEPEDSPACTGRLGVLVAAAAAVASQRREGGDGLLPAAAHSRILAALRSLARDAPAPHGAAALALLADGVGGLWWGVLRKEPERVALVDDALALCERLAAPAAAGGGATELMVAREAGAELLAALVVATSHNFLAVLAARLAPTAPDSPAHMTAFVSLIRAAQTQPALLLGHLDRSVEAVCAAFVPTASGARRTCATGAAGFLAELVARLSAHVAHHRGSGRVAVASAHGVPPSLLRVYDTSGASGSSGTGLLRTLDGNHEEPADLSECTALSFDADGGRVSAYHASGSLRFWVLAPAAASWRHARGLPPARACAVPPPPPSARRAVYRLDWVAGFGAGVALHTVGAAPTAPPVAFLPVVAPH